MANKRGQGEGSISRRPDGTWWARITLGKDENGKQKRKAFYGKTRKEVQEKLTAALNGVNTGTYFEPTKMTVGQWLDFWRETYKKRTVRSSSLRNIDIYIKNFIKPSFGNCPLKDLRKEQVQMLINNLVDADLSISTINSVQGCLHGALQQAVDNGLITKNVAKRCQMPKGVRSQMRVMTPEEQQRFEQAANEFINGHIFILILYTGLRIGEAIALTWEDIDLEKGLLVVNKTATKSYHGTVGEHRELHIGPPKTKASYRTIPLIPEIIEMLQKMKTAYQLFGHCSNVEPQSPVFQNGKKEMIPHDSVWRKFRRIVEAAKIENPKELHPHSLRHTFATRGLESGIPIKVMQELLGHSTLSMTADLYTHVLPEQKRASIMLLSHSEKSD